MIKFTNARLKVIALVCLVAIFLMDTQTPLGIADAMCYIAVVLLTIWIPGRATFVFGVAGILLTVIGFALSPSGEAFEIALTNRILAVLGIFTAIVVVQKFKNAQQKILSQKDTMDSLFNYASEGILFTDADGMILLSNPKVEQITGYSQATMKGRNIRSLFPPESVADFAEKIENSAYEEVSFETKAMKQNGDLFFARVNLTSFEEKDDRRFVVFIADITLRKQQEENLKEAHRALTAFADKLHESNTDLENFAYIVSHDLQEPLRKIQSFGNRIEVRMANNLDEPDKEDLGRVIKAAGRMQIMINDLLMLSRVKTREKPLIKTDLNLVLQEVLDDLEIAIQKSSATIIPGNLPVIDADDVQMRQVFQNLLANAIKFRKQIEPLVIRIDSKILNDNHTPRAEITFSDNGIGFDPKYNQKIFQIFNKLNGAEYDGSGIGLSICKKIISRHNGTITPDSTPGIGTSFTLTLPVDCGCNNNQETEDRG
jgi:two-component system, LuxR family, sensor kinase FixL